MSVQQAQGLQTMEDIVGNITRILVLSGGLDGDPLAGRANELFYDGILAQLQAENFHPGKRLGVVDGSGAALPDEQVRGEAALAALDEAQWDVLAPVGSMRAPSIAFARGTSNLSIQGERDVGDVVRQLKAWPSYYITVVGHARAEGDADANLTLARDRAQTVRNRIIRDGIDPNRVRAIAARSSGTGGQYQSVVFVFGQQPY
jgi:outer membrane protein OmpA-like peptidoglycan-associated protein